MNRDEALEKLDEFYRRVDELAGRLARVHADRLNCRKGCAGCCVEGISVFTVEAANIRRRHPDLLAHGEPGPEGACAFLDGEGACRIYPDRPYVCRTQGLPLRWFEELRDELFELRDICPLNEEGEPVEELPADECWTIGEFEALLRELETAFNEHEPARVRLRDLFRS